MLISGGSVERPPTIGAFNISIAQIDIFQNAASDLKPDEIQVGIHPAIESLGEGNFV